MKTTCLALFPLLLLVLSTNTLPAAAQKPVLDAVGNILEPGAEYYVLPYIWGPLGGGLALKQSNNCSSYVISLPSEVSNGSPVRINPWNSKIGWVPESTDLQLEFTGIGFCSHRWKVTNLPDKETGEYFVTGGGFGGPRSCGTINSWFKIEKSEEGFSDFVYKIVYCPTFCPSVEPICKSIGVYHEDGSRRLYLTDEPHKVVFVKVIRSSAA